MKMRAECVPCLLRRTLHEVDMVDPSKEHEVMVDALRIITKRFPDHPVSIDVATEVHRNTYRLLGTEDPYREYKRKATEVARRILPLAREVIEEASDPLEAMVLVSIVGNVLDFGIPGGMDRPEKLESLFMAFFNEGLGVSHLPEIRKHFRGRIAFFTDNCGEIILDLPLMEYLSEVADLTVVVKASPILSDATMEDAMEAGIHKFAEIMTTGSNYVGVNPEDFPQELWSLLDNTEIIISKGMANYEGFTETDLRPIAYLLRTKCRPVAEDAGLPLGVNAAFLVK